MIAEENGQIRLATRPTGQLGPQVWEHTRAPIPRAGVGRLVVRVSHISVDPAMRGYINAGTAYLNTVDIGEVMFARGVGEVVESNNPAFKVGDTVTGVLGVQDYVESDGTGLLRISPTSEIPPERFLAMLGTTGMTAYFGLLDVGSVRCGDTVVVSGAAGAVGTVVGQIAKIKGCRVIGIAGGPEKCEWLTSEIGFDAVIDYRSEDVSAALKILAPNGIDVYFDNVGGEILDAALGQLAMHARVVICGAVSQYNTDGAMQGPANYLTLLTSRSRMEGFVVDDYAEHFGEARMQLAGWLADGKIISREDVVNGTVDDFPQVLLRLFRGENTGKLVLRLSH